MEEGATIGVGFAAIDDDDPGVGGYNGFWTNSGATGLDSNANYFVDYILTPFDPSIWVRATSSVETDTWGRIESTFSD